MFPNFYNNVDGKCQDTVKVNIGERVAGFIIFTILAVAEPHFDKGKDNQQADERCNCLFPVIQM